MPPGRVRWAGTPGVTERRSDGERPHRKRPPQSRAPRSKTPARRTGSEMAYRRGRQRCDARHSAAASHALRRPAVGHRPPRRCDARQSATASHTPGRPALGRRPPHAATPGTRPPPATRRDARHSAAASHTPRRPALGRRPPRAPSSAFDCGTPGFRFGPRPCGARSRPPIPRDEPAAATVRLSSRELLAGARAAGGPTPRRAKPNQHFLRTERDSPAKPHSHDKPGLRPNKRRVPSSHAPEPRLPLAQCRRLGHFRATPPIAQVNSGGSRP